jgi:hypothetical protein
MDQTWTSPDGKYQNQTDYILGTHGGKAPQKSQKQYQLQTVGLTMNSELQLPGLS